MGRLTHFLLGIGLLTGGYSSYGAAQTTSTLPFDIAAGSAPNTLKQFASQAHVQLLFDYKAIKNLQTPALKGQLYRRQALELLLHDTGLSFGEINDHTIAISSAQSSTGSTGPISNTVETQSQAVNTGPQSTGVEGRKTKLTSGESSAGLEEIIVTAERRGAERLIDTPISVTALDASALSQSGINSIPDLVNFVPGMTISTNGPGITQISLRGVTAGQDISATTAIYYDDVPIGSRQVLYNLDASLFDLDRIEVLRGPQGTQYGVASMGGLIKYVTKMPDLSTFSGTAQSGVSDTHGGGISFNEAMAVNVPVISDELAFRAAAFETHDGGYIDRVQLADPNGPTAGSNVLLKDRNANRSDTYGARLDALFVPVDSVSLRVSGLEQTINRAGGASVDFALNGQPLVGPLDQVRFVAEPFTSHFSMIDSTISYNPGPVQLISITSYQSLRDTVVQDQTQELVPYLPLYYNIPNVATAAGIVDYNVDKFTQEIRVASYGFHGLDWLVGAFYSHTSLPGNVYVEGYEASGIVSPYSLYHSTTDGHEDELSGFANLTLHATDRFEITGGIRYADITVQNDTYTTGALSPGNNPPLKATNHVPTYLGNASYHIDPNQMVYVRYATGYRPGGPNAVPPSIGPAVYTSDSLKSYEGGYKSSLFDHRIGIDFDVYKVNWSNIQVNTLSASPAGVFGFNINAPGGASITGSELALTARPMPGLEISATLTYIDAYMREADIPLGATAGEVLPNVPRFAGSLGAQYTFAQYSIHPWIGASAHYTDARWASFNNAVSYPQYHLPDYTTLDLKGGARFGNIDAQLYVRNVTDKLGQNCANTAVSPFAQVCLTQPRTIGASANVRF